jgi:hypothetical protein
VKASDAAAIRSAPAVRKRRRPWRSTSAPIRGTSTTTKPLWAAVTSPISGGRAWSAVKRNFGSTRKVENA